MQGVDGSGCPHLLGCVRREFWSRMRPQLVHLPWLALEGAAAATVRGQERFHGRQKPAGPGNGTLALFAFVAMCASVPRDLHLKDLPRDVST